MAFQDIAALRELTPGAVAQPRAAFNLTQPGRVRLAYEGARGVMTVTFRVLGVLFVLMAPLMWFWPQGGVSDLDAVTLKFGTTLFLLLSGLVLLMRNHQDALPEVEFDIARKEMRLRQRDMRGRWDISLTYPFEALASIRVTDRVMSVENTTGQTVLQMRLRDRASEDVLRSLLSDDFAHMG